ncbi:transcriptional regulator [Spirilliplanes yamanashiensis]|uniref:Transcriptional regulator n=2 Tax=Spirilliplanes yamanashiensis TaxID=42233 RepID=A0A8J3Y9N1_9ACTN|nr:hypothetical protein [Spirilliplanes yamanashiensis]GIJ03758.1 transcriptional regulator [Spirilliplanes yamanashiensis]
MEWSLSKVIRIENGDVSISPNDLRPLLAYLGVDDRAVVDDLVRATRTARERRAPWWHEPEFRGITPSMGKLIEAENAAQVSWAFNPTMVPGRLQVLDYAQAVLANYSEELTPDEIHARQEARIRRRDAFLKSTARMNVLIDESVLYRTIGSPPDVLRGQLDEIVRLIERRRVRARVIPLNFDGPLVTFGMFELFYLAGDDDPAHAVLYSEDWTMDQVVEDPVRIARHRAKLDQLWDMALSDEDSLELIRTRSKELATTSSARPRQR